MTEYEGPVAILDLSMLAEHDYLGNESLCFSTGIVLWVGEYLPALYFLSTDSFQINTNDLSCIHIM